MSVQLNEHGLALLSTTVVSFAAAATTALYTVPTGYKCILFAAAVEPGADPVDVTVTIGSSGTTATSFLGTQTVHTNVDTASEAGWLMPIPHGTTVAFQVYSAGDVIQMTTTNSGGGASNNVYLFGFLVAA